MAFDTSLQVIGPPGIQSAVAAFQDVSIIHDNFLTCLLCNGTAPANGKYGTSISKLPMKKSIFPICGNSDNSAEEQ